VAEIKYFSRDDTNARALGDGSFRKSLLTEKQLSIAAKIQFPGKNSPLP
jgi:hypothetical protein